MKDDKVVQLYEEDIYLCCPKCDGTEFELKILEPVRIDKLGEHKGHAYIVCPDCDVHQLVWIDFSGGEYCIESA